MTISEFFQQNASAIITAVPATLFSLGSLISSIDAMLNTRRNRRLAFDRGIVTDRKIDTVQASVENGYHTAVKTAVAVAAETAAAVAADLTKKTDPGGL